MTQEQVFFQLLQIVVRTKDVNSFSIGEQEWHYCYEQASRQSLLAVLFPAVQKFMRDENGKRIKPLFSEWLAAALQTSERNKILVLKTKDLIRIFKSWGFHSCILKGQGIATLYPAPEYRQSGDIDIWVYGRQKDIVNCMRRNFVHIENIDYVHSGVSILTDAAVEVHFRPSWMYNPFSNRKLQRFFKNNAEKQFANKDIDLGFAHPTISFNLVYSLIHINRHIFEEGIGLRQLMDYFYILRHSTSEERSYAYAEIKKLRLKKFAGAIMYIMQEVFALEQEYLLCHPNREEGLFLLEETMRGGNFGQYDSRNEWYGKEQRIRRGLFNAKRNLRYFRHYPSEVAWIIPWKLWHWCWRKWNGYL